jgi:S-adenosylhomocysteine hydrolase
MDFSRIDQSIPKSLPVLDRWVEKHGDRNTFKGVTVLQIQHQLGNHFPQARALLDLGLEPSKLIWVDIPYTSIPEVRRALIEELAIPATNFHIHDFRVLDRYPPYQIKRVQEIFARLIADPPDRLVVLDDGAYFLEASSSFAKQLPAVAIVEQTTRGLIKLEENPTLRSYASQFPIVNVARSDPKSALEPPFIGRAVCDALFRRIKPLIDISRRFRCLVLGFGAIGRQVAAFIPKKFDLPRSHVHVHDPSQSRQRAALEAGFSYWDRNNFNVRFHLVVGCSGRKSLILGDRIYLGDGAVLASASSGTVELSRQDFIELADVSEIDDISIIREGLDERNVHSDLHIKLVDRSVTFVNGGFPVNFDGRVNCIPGRYIQPTPTMMVAAAKQAVETLKNQQKGIVELDPAFCKWVAGTFREELGDESALIPPAA